MWHWQKLKHKEYIIQMIVSRVYRQLFQHLIKNYLRIKNNTSFLSNLLYVLFQNEPLVNGQLHKFFICKYPFYSILVCTYISMQNYLFLLVDNIIMLVFKSSDFLPPLRFETRNSIMKKSLKTFNKSYTPQIKEIIYIF